MLEYLRIQNLALIADMELEFLPGLNVLTGETGAGKSFILKALNFLTGDKIGPDLVRPGEEKATVEALFALPDQDYIFRRELTAATGRSRLFINDSLSSLEAARALRPSLLAHTSQHGQQRLLQPAFQRSVVDSFVEDKSLLSELDALTAALKTLATQKQQLAERTTALSSQREFLEFQQQEIAKVAPEHGEEGELEARKQELREHEYARVGVQNTMQILHGQDIGLLDAVSALDRELSAVVQSFPDFKEERLAVEDFREFLLDLDSKLRRRQTQDTDKNELENIESRLYALAQLKRKLKRSLDEIVDMSKEIEENLSFLDACGLEEQRLAKEERRLVEQISAQLDRVNQARREAGARLTEALEAELKQLGFSEHVRVICEHDPTPAAPEYPDLLEERARFLWQPNPGQPPQPLDKIASGGELSRFLLALVSLTAAGNGAAPTASAPAADEGPTLIFDEVDAGVGGLTLGSLGAKLKDLAGRQQMLLITHWPQLASMADKHFQVIKEFEEGQTFTRCAPLTQEEIFNELTRMAGGGEQGAALARELLG